MHWVVMLLLSLVWLVGCAPHEAAPLPPPPPEDLSTWTVPEVVQPPAPALPAEEDKPTAAEKVYAFTPGTPYTVQVPMGWPLDIVLERGEQVHNIVGGDRAPEPGTPAPGHPASEAPTERLQAVIAQATATPPPPAPEGSPGARRWEVREGVSGTGETRQAHLFVAASAPGLTTGLVVTTTRRTYYLTCQSVKTSPIRVLRWHYPPRPTDARRDASLPRLWPDPAHPARYHVGYLVEPHGRVPDWSPRVVVDDGKKLYIVYPAVTLFGTVPVVRKVGPNGPQLVNARQFLNVVILDELVAQAELRVGIGVQAEQVTITRGALRTIDCPGDDACPVWPAATETRARRAAP